jgi:hypothetical protein
MAEVKECPRCRATFVIPIEHGMPGAELIERARRGEAAMGGCVVFDDLHLIGVAPVVTSGRGDSRGQVPGRECAELVIREPPYRIALCISSLQRCLGNA